MNPEISIIIPFYNSSKTISRCIESIKKQIFCSYEVILINDGSNDCSVKLVKELIQNCSNFHLINRVENLGVSFSRNQGINNSLGEYICFIDSDDRYADEYSLQLMYDHVKKDMFSTFGYKIFRNNKILKSIPPLTLNLFKMSILNYCGNQSTIIKKELLKGILQKNIPHEDYIFWYEIIYINNLAPKTYPDIIVNKFETENSITFNKIKSVYMRFKSSIFLIINLKSPRVISFQLVGFLLYFFFQFNRLIKFNEK